MKTKALELLDPQELPLCDRSDAVSELGAVIEVPEKSFLCMIEVPEGDCDQRGLESDRTPMVEVLPAVEKAQIMEVVLLLVD